MKKLLSKMIGEYNTYSILRDLEKMKIRNNIGSETDLARYQAFVDMSLNVITHLSESLNLPFYHSVEKYALDDYQILYDRISTKGD